MISPSDCGKVAVLTLGCSKNLVDAENLIGMLKSSGVDVGEDPNNADTVIINTCGFIDSAKEESINLILQASEMKRRKKIKKLIVFGCLSQRYSESIKNQIPMLDEVFGVNSNAEILRSLGLEPNTACGRSLLTLPHYSYLKISEGCSHKCAYCAIPLIRGPYVSRPIEDIIKEAETLALGGVKEINIIAQDTTYYGRDLYNESRLAEVLSRVSDIKEFKWVRLLYAYPVAFPMKVAEVIAERENICKYLDLPLQHISDKVLKAMGRGSREERIKKLVENLKSIIPGLALRTTFIVGFPNETESDFEKLMRFTEETRFTRMGVFAYSPEEGTPAFPLGDPIRPEIKAERIDRIMSLQQSISFDLNQEMVDKQIEVIVDASNKKAYLGRTRNDAPEIDNGVIIRSKSKLTPGSIILAKVKSATEYDLEVTYKKTID